MNWEGCWITFSKFEFERSKNKQINVAYIPPGVSAGGGAVVRVEAKLIGKHLHQVAIAQIGPWQVGF